MTWLQQVIFAALGMNLSAGAVQAGACNNVAHVPETDVQHRAEGVDLNSGFFIDVNQLDVPVVVDVLGKTGRPRIASGNVLSGETLVGIATIDGQSVTFQGPAVNEGEPVIPGPDCTPLEPGEIPGGRHAGGEGEPRP